MMKKAANDPVVASARRARARARRRRTEGAALLVVMLIIIVTTAAAAVSVRNTSNEVRAAGRETTLVHARYASEAALATSIAWLDIVGESGALTQLWNAWDLMAPPEVREYTGGHSINNDASRHMASRSTQGAQMMLAIANVQPISAADLAAPIPDPTGSFGPQQVYVPSPYVADLTDCFEAPPTPGNPLNGAFRQFYCVLTVRGRLVVPNNAGRAITWLNVGGLQVTQDRSGVAHDARASILTAPLP